MSEELPLLDNSPLSREGVIDRVIFHNRDNGFSVLKIQIGEGKKAENEIMVGHLDNPRPGCRMRFSGQYTNNQRFGRQFAFESAEEIMPATSEGIRLYLGSGLIKGLGPEIAGRIVEKFGLETIRILDENPDELKSVRGIGKKNLEQIKKSWAEHRGIRELMLFLQPHGISAAYAVRIYRAYGEEALHVARQNPYRLAMDIRGFGFLTADMIATKLGFTADHPLRIKAATLYSLQRASEEGHVFLPRNVLIEKVCKQIGVEEQKVISALIDLESEQRLVCEPQDSEEIGVYLKRFYHCESKTAFYLQRLLRSPKSVMFADRTEAIAKVLSKLPINLAEQQIRALETATQSKILVITGGPGTGKTTIINAIIKIYDSAKAKILLAAPTGRAAKRMSETSGREAKTIHRLLEYSPGDDLFGRNEDSPLNCGLLVIDEASMMDAQLFYQLLKSVPLGATLILVGDANQLPSVGPGNVLDDIIASRTIPVVELNEIFRQSAESDIICNAHLINRGKMPMLEHSDKALSDFYFIAKTDPEESAQFMVDLIKNHIPRRFGFDPINEIQLLTPMHRGAVGAENMNALLQAALNPNGQEIRRGERCYRVNDKVMQVRNNYDKDVFNGDIGRIVKLNRSEKWLSVDFDGITVPYEYDDLDELVPAYAISIHKSQGSEYPAVVIPLMMQHYILLQRNLVYTAITRGKKLVILVGETRALEIAIKNDKTGRRYTRLARRLAESSEF